MSESCNLNINKLNERLKYKYIADDKSAFNTDIATSSIEAFNNYTKRAIQSTLAYKLYDVLHKNIDAIDKGLERKIHIYKSTKTYLKGLSDNTFVQQFNHWLNNDKFKFRDIQHKFLTIYQHATEERNKIDDTYVADLNNKLQKHFSEDEIKKLDIIFGRSGIFHLTKDDTYEKLKTGAVTLVQLMKDMKLSEEDIRIANNISAYMLGEPISGNIITNSNVTKDKVRVDKIFKYATLKTLSKVDDIEAIFKKLDSNDKLRDIHDELIIASQSMESIYKNLLKNTKDPDYMSYSLHIDVYNKAYEKRVVTIEDLKNKGFLERNGWKILRKPTSNTLGVVYRESQQQSLEGVGTTTNYQLNDLIVPKSTYLKYRNDNYVTTSTRSGQYTHMLPLTLEEKRKLGLIENPAHTLYRSISKYKFIQDTQIIRDTLVDDMLTKKIDPNKEEDVNKLKDLIKKDEHPFYLKLPKDTIYQDLPDEIKSKYEQVTHISKIGKLDQKVDLVRKDISPWLQGYAKASIFNSPTLNKLLQGLQKLVVMGKIHNIVASPTKLLMDGVSNITLLLSRGVSPLYIASEIPKANKDIAKLHELRAELVQAKLNDLIDPKGDQTKKVLNKIKKHPLNFVFFNGMMTSLSTDIFSKSEDTISGLQQDVDNIVSRLVHKADSEDLNNLGKIIKWYMHFGSKQGLSVDNLLNKLSNIGEKGILKQSLQEIATNMKETRDNDDIVRYVSNFINTPASNFTKAGSVIMQYEDLISRIILYKHLRSQGIKNEQAVQDVMDTFIDYRINMPKELQFASDTFILPFPHYMIKIQKVILNLLKHRPATVGFNLAYDIVNPYSAANDMSVIGSNIIDKVEQGRLIGNPLDLISIFQ